MVRIALTVLILGLMAATSGPLRAQVASPHAIDHPAWFASTFLDYRDDLREAAAAGKRLVTYFGQDGCPYCARLMQTNFTQPALVAKTRKHFVVTAINIWGDREVTWLDGRTLSEKEFAKHLRIQFTPTLVFFDEKGNVVVRLNGYYPPHRLDAVLDYVAGRLEKKTPFPEYMAGAVKEAASATLHAAPFFRAALHDLRRKPGGKPLAVVFETPFCSGCDELHREGFKRAEVLAQIAKFDVVRFDIGERTELTTPAGKRVRAEDWARELKIAYTPSIVFFAPSGREVFRLEAYVRPFHLAGSFAYVATREYAKQPSFQRFLQAHAEHLRAQGKPVDLWQ